MAYKEEKRSVLKAAMGKFRDAGTKYPDMEVTSSKSSKPKKIYPHLSFSGEVLPEIKDWKVGETYDLMVRVKQVSYEKGDSLYGKGREEARFEVHGVRPMTGMMDHKK